MKTEVLIIGGGVAGLALAVLLGNAGLKTCVVERGKLPTTKEEQHYGRTAALMGPSVNILKALGLWDEISANTAPLQTMRIVDDGNPKIEPIEISFPANDLELDAFGHNVPNKMLHLMLADKTRETKNITVFESVNLESVEHFVSTAKATLDDGAEIEAKIIIGADGRFSKVREINNIDTTLTDYNQGAITCLMSHSKPHDNISTEHHRSGGPFTTVPMPDKDGKHFSSVVWVEKMENAETFMALEPSDFENTLQECTRGALGDIKLESAPEMWPLKAILAKQFIATRTALIAEAAHAMSPIGAQGLNLSLRDVATIAEILVDAARVGQDIGSNAVLQTYDNRRRIDMKTRFFGVDGYNRLVSNNVEFIRVLRRTGLKSINNIPALKQFAMNQGLAPKMDEGRLIRGEKL